MLLVEMIGRLVWRSGHPFLAFVGAMMTTGAMVGSAVLFLLRRRPRLRH